MPGILLEVSTAACAFAPIGPNGFPGTGVNLGGAAKHNKWTDKVEKLSNCADNLVKKNLSKMIMDRLRHLNALELLALLFAIVAEFQDRMQGSVAPSFWCLLKTCINI